MINQKDLKSLVTKVVENLSDDLRKKPYRGSSDPVAGHCYVASEALYHLLNSSDWLSCNVNHEGSSHWYLKNKVTGEILDATASQFSTPVPYNKGKGKGFLTKKASKRAQELLRRLGNLEIR